MLSTEHPPFHLLFTIFQQSRKTPIDHKHATVVGGAVATKWQQANQTRNEIIDHRLQVITCNYN